MSVPNEFDLGERVLMEARFNQAPTTVTLQVLRPDGTLVDPAPGVDASQAPYYRASTIGDTPGTWAFRFTGTGAYEAIEEGYFVIIPSAVESGVPRYTYDLETAIGKLRLLVDDRDLSRVSNAVPMEQRSAIWTDDELRVFLNNHDQGVYLAAAEALTVLAGNRQLLVQSRRIGRTEVNYGSVRSDLLKQAEKFESLGYLELYETGVPADGIAEVAYTDFSVRRIVDNTSVREGF